MPCLLASFTRLLTSSIPSSATPPWTGAGHPAGSSPTSGAPRPGLLGTTASWRARTRKTLWPTRVPMRARLGP
eukprot:3218100-Lingulodinium_polyedra.AAC.1